MSLNTACMSKDRIEPMICIFRGLFDTFQVNNCILCSLVSLNAGKIESTCPTSLFSPSYPTG